MREIEAPLLLTMHYLTTTKPAALSAAKLRHSLGQEEAASAIEDAVRAHLADGARTADLGGEMGTGATAEAVAGRV